ncbi:MAG: thiol-disulfide oxidoreductase ResA [Tuberibacillus sp.]
MTETQYISGRRLKLFVRIIATLVILAAVIFTIYEVVKDKSTVSVGEKAPDFELKTMDGQIVKLSDLKGQGILLNFWGTWCDPCKKEMPAINAAEERHLKDVKIIAVNIRETTSDVRKFYKRYHLNFTTVLDRNGKVKDAYHIDNIPSTFLIDKNGVVVKKITGPMESVDDVVKNLKRIQP